MSTSANTTYNSYHGIKLEDLDMNIMKYIAKIADGFLLDFDDDDEYEGLMNMNSEQTLMMMTYLIYWRDMHQISILGILTELVKKRCKFFL